MFLNLVRYDENQPVIDGLANDYIFEEATWGKFYYKIYESYMTYQDAKAQCEFDGAYLFIPRSDVENSYIVDLFTATLNWSFWIGVNDINQEGKYISVIDGLEVTYTNWAYGEPSQASENDFNEDAVEILGPSSGSRQSYWNDVKTYTNNPFICSYRIQEREEGKYFSFLNLPYNGKCKINSKITTSFCLNLCFCI